MSTCLKVWAWRHSLSAPFVWPETHSICLYQRSVWCMVHSTEWLVFLSAFYLLVSSRGAYHIHAYQICLYQKECLVCIPHAAMTHHRSREHHTIDHTRLCLELGGNSCSSFLCLSYCLGKVWSRRVLLEIGKVLKPSFVASFGGQKEIFSY